jgi:abhydrolase domain-containing protein 8
MTTRTVRSGQWRANRIAPAPGPAALPNIVEIRKGRWLHVQHLLPAENSHGEQTNSNHRQWMERLDNWATSFAYSITEGCTKESQDTMCNTNSNNHVSNADMASQGSLHSVLDDGNTVFFFIHGVGGCSDLWSQQMSFFLGRGYEVVAPDLLGHGLSRAPRRSKAYAFTEHAQDMLAVFDRYSRKRNILVGHSYGACFCTKIAVERARKVTKVVLISGGGPIPLEPETCHLFCLPSPLLSCIKPLIVNEFIRQAFHKDSQQEKEAKERAFDVPAYVLRATMQGQLWTEGDEAYHATVGASVLLIYGLQDSLVLLDDEEWMNETIYASHLETLENAGHMVMIEQPERVNQLIHNFALKDTMVHRRRVVHRTASTRSTKLSSHGKTMPHVTIS